MSENKTGKYLKYAIGEIVLVVIGILIALQINNWNEKRKDHSLGKIYLISISKDLEATQLNLETQLERIPRHHRHIDNTINYIGLDSTELTQGMKDTIGSTWHYETKVIVGGINALLNSGKLELISNDSIKMNLTEYPAFVSSFETAMNGLSDVVKKEQRIILERHYSLTDHLTDTIKYPNLKKRAQPSNFKSLLNDRAYQNTLVKVTYHLFVTRLEAEKLLNKTSKLLEKIEREIENN